MADKGLTYRDAGVDIEEGDALVERIKPHARRTARPEILAGIGRAASGLHSNGYSLARKVFERDLPAPLVRELLEPTRIYVKDCLALREAVDVHAFAHITGGGLPGNLPRVLPPGHRASLRRGSWPVPPIFGRIQQAGNVSDTEMLRTFNMGVGMCAVVARGDAARTIDFLVKR